MLSNIFNKLPNTVRHWLSILAALRHWLDSQAFIYAAALAFFTVFSIAPILVVIVALVGLVIGERAVQGELFTQLEETLGSEAAGVVQTAVVNSQIDQSGFIPALVGIVATIIGATTVFAQMQQSLNQIYYRPLFYLCLSGLYRDSLGLWRCRFFGIITTMGKLFFDDFVVWCSLYPCSSGRAR
jgi:membrane protein